MPTKLEIKRLNNSKNEKLNLEEKLAELDPTCEEYSSITLKLVKVIATFNKRLNICINKKLLSVEEIEKYRNIIILQDIPNKFLLEQQRIEEERIRLEHERIMNEERIRKEDDERKLIEERSKRSKIKAKLRIRK